MEKGGKPDNGQTIEEAINEISLGGMVVKNVNRTLDKTYQEIYDSLAAGTPVFIIYEDAGNSAWGVNFVSYVFTYDGDYIIRTVDGNASTPTLIDYTAQSADGYPTIN